MVMLGASSFAIGKEPPASQASAAQRATNERSAGGAGEIAQSKTSSADKAKRDMEDFLRTRAELLREMSMATEGARGGSQKARMQALNEWSSRNASRIEAVRQQGARVFKAQVPSSIPLIGQAEIPRNASVELKEFSVEKAKLVNEMAGIQNRLRQSPAEMERALQEWQRNNLGKFEAQQQRARAMADQGKSKPLPVPAAPLIPQDASPELKTFLTERHALLLDLADFESRTAQLSPSARDEALARWQKENAARFQNLARKAAALPEK